MSRSPGTLRSVLTSRTFGHFLACAGLAILTAAVFSNALGYEFVNFDDWFLIEQDRTLRSLSWPSVSRMLFYASNQGVWLPLRVLSYAVDYRFWGMDAFGFHLTSLLLHVANVLLAYAVLNWLLRRPWLAVLGAAWFAVHPVQVESVTWVSGRRDVLYAFFFLLALLAFIGNERASGRKQWLLYAASLVLTGCSLLSKASGMMLPAILLLVGLVRGEAGKPVWLPVAAWLEGKRRMPWGLYAIAAVLAGVWLAWSLLPFDWAASRPPWVTLLLAGALAAVLFVETNRVGWHRLAAVLPHGLLAVVVTLRHYHFAAQSEVIKGELFGKHLASMPWIFASYFRLLLFPTHLSTPQARVPLRWGETEEILVALAVVVAVVAVAWWAAPRRSMALFCLGWWFLLLLPFSNLVPLSMLVAERYLYVPLLGACALGAAVVGGLAARWKWPTVACALAVVGLLAVATHSRNRVWSDSRLFWWDGVSKWPEAPVPRIGLADAYTSTGQLELAWRQYETVTEPPPREDAPLPAAPRVINTSLLSVAGVAHSDNPEHIQLVNRGLLTIYDRLGRQLESKGRMEEALDVYVTTVQRMPNDVGPRVNLAEAYERRGMVDRAIQQVRAIQKIDEKRPGLAEWIARLEARGSKGGGE